MTRQELISQIYSKKNYLCVGLDTDLTKIPSHLLSEPDPVFSFNKQIIDATLEYCVAYKINTAFYEAMGMRGWETMEKTVKYIPSTHFRIADAKRGDIGNTSSQYAKAFFDTLDFDAITVAPYMGSDSVKPFLAFEGKWAIVLGLTSNPGAQDFEFRELTSESDYLEEGVHVKMESKEPFYKTVLRTVSQWGTSSNLMFVIGATQPDEFLSIRAILPDHFFLVPGVGAQGGSLKEISEKALIPGECGILVNASRSIIYASGNKDFASAARAIAKEYSTEMATYLR